MIFGWLKQLFLSKWTLLVSSLVVGWQVWTVLQPKPWAPDELQKAAAEAVCWRAAQAMPPLVSGVPKIVVLRLGGRDTDGWVSKQLAECVQRTGRYEVLHETLEGNLRRNLSIDEKPVTTIEEAAKVGHKSGVWGVLFGEVAEFRSDRSSATIRLNLRLARVDDAQSIWGESLAASEPPSSVSMVGMRESVDAASAVKRILLWLALAAILPLLLIPIIKRLLNEESNAVNFSLLAALTLIDLAVAHTLCGFRVFEWIPAILTLLALVAGAVYNYWLCSTIERLR